MDCFWFKFNNFRLALRIDLKVCTSVGKELRVKVTKFFSGEGRWRGGVNLTIPEVKVETGEWIHFAPILNRAKTLLES